jgi:peptidoglycan hydrolase-like protein with peptidoglycan-binding domain
LLSLNPETTAVDAGLAPSHGQRGRGRVTPVSLIVLHAADGVPNRTAGQAIAGTEEPHSVPDTSPSAWHTTVSADSVCHHHSSDAVLNHVRGWNTRTLGIGLLTAGDRWEAMPGHRLDRLVENAARVVAWYCKTHDLPVEQVTSFDEARRGRRGLIAHSVLDTSCHDDPGSNFPWDRLLAGVKRFMRAEQIVGPGDCGTQVSAAQARLTDLGYGDVVGPVDGMAGPRFVQAVRSYEVDRGLAVTGLWVPPLDLDRNEDPENPSPFPGAIHLVGPVDARSDSRPDDRRAVLERLDALGFMRPGRGLDYCIRLFQSTIRGHDSLRSVDGRIDPDGLAHQWLNALNAPRWMRVPRGSAEEGFRCRAQIDLGDDHWWATDWLIDAVRAVAARYRSMGEDQQVLRVLAASPLAGGGDGEAGTQSPNGLGVELALPTSVSMTRLATVEAETYDRDATRSLLQAIWEQGSIDAVYLADPELAGEGRCQQTLEVRDRLIVTIRPPEPLFLDRPGSR